MLICPDCVGPLGGADTVACASCGWTAERIEGIPCFLSRRDRADTVIAEYLDNYDEIARDDLDSGFIDERYIDNQAKNIAAGARLAAREKICDIGAGKGYLLRALLDAGAAEVTAVDISLPYLRRFASEPRIRPIVANAENLPFADEFDTIFCTDVMEHVLNLGSFLFSLNRALKLGGVAHVRVPYLENSAGILAPSRLPLPLRPSPELRPPLAAADVRGSRSRRRALPVGRLLVRHATAILDAGSRAGAALRFAPSVRAAPS